MPQRLLRDWTDSLRFDGLTAEAERLFVRLLMRADDYGRYHADARLLRSGCFPLAEELRAAEVQGWLEELASRGLVVVYPARGAQYLAVPRFGQRFRASTPRYPAPDGMPANWVPDEPAADVSPATVGGSPQPAAAVGGSPQPAAAVGVRARHSAASCGDSPQITAVFGDGDGDGDGREEPRALVGLSPEQCRGWTAAKYAEDLRGLRPEYARVTDLAVLQALQSEADPDQRAAAYCQWRSADMGSLDADRRPGRTLAGYLRNVRRFAPGAGHASGYDPVTDTREEI